MGYLQARSGIARSGVTYCGWTPPLIRAFIGGTDRTSLILRSGWSLQASVDGTPSVFRFRTKTITPLAGQDVAVYYATPNDYLFAGTLLQRRAVPVAPTSPYLQWECTAVGYQWLLDRYDRVLKTYTSTGVGTMVADILYRYTDGGFKLGFCPSSLGNLTMTFTFETVYAALQRIAKAVGAVLEVSPGRIVNIYVKGTFPEAALSSVAEANVLGKTLTFDEDLTQVRTRTLYRGAGSTASAVASPGAATIAVDDTANFSATGGYVIAGTSIITYTGVSPASGSGSLTGCSGVLDDIAVGDAVDLLVNVSDGAAITALATVLGGGLSGQATNYLEDGRLSFSEATARSSADLATFSTALKDLSFVLKLPKRLVRAGRAITLSISNPFSMAGDFTIQAVTLTPYGKVGGTSFEVLQRIDLGNFRRTMQEVMTELRG